MIAAGWTPALVVIAGVAGGAAALSMGRLVVRKLRGERAGSEDRPIRRD